MALNHFPNMLRTGLAFLTLGSARSDPSCWTGGVTREQCCDVSLGPKGNVACWDESYTFDRCCEPSSPVVVPSWGEECIERGIVLRNAGEHAIFADVSNFGHTGCFQNNCKLTDKFNAADPGICARLCDELEECTHWTFGFQDGTRKCFLRKGDGGREQAAGWSSGTKACKPEPLPAGFTAITVAESNGLTACDRGKSEQCPDVLAAINTWRYAIKHLRRATEGRVDSGTLQHVTQIEQDSANLAANVVGEYRPSDADFPRVVYNNRLIFNTLRDYLLSMPTVELTADDGSLPNPLRTGKLCGQTSCYED